MSVALSLRRWIPEAKRGVTLLLGRLRAGRGDHAGLLTFSDTVTVEVELGPIANVFDEIANRVSFLSAQGRTSLVDGIVTALRRLPLPNGAIQAVVVLTDGRENNSKSTTDDIFSTLATYTPKGPRIHCLSYGDDTDNELLLLIARASRGTAYAGSYSGIEELFERIGYHF
jgi:Mg-chelatase subunit ChlD